MHRGKEHLEALRNRNEILLNAFAAQQNFEYCGAVMRRAHDLVGYLRFIPWPSGRLPLGHIAKL